MRTKGGPTRVPTHQDGLHTSTAWESCENAEMTQGHGVERSCISDKFASDGKRKRNHKQPWYILVIINDYTPLRNYRISQRL